MNKIKNVRKNDYKKRIAIKDLALQLIDDCYKGKPSKESMNDFLTKISLLKDEVGSKC